MIAKPLKAYRKEGSLMTIEGSIHSFSRMNLPHSDPTPVVSEH